MKSHEIRQSFVEYFKGKDHKELPSSPVIPFDDPTILFTNAGMNQFKDIFTGKKKAEYKRAVTVQKCMRAGGKHNDLENVGRTGRHHTFFEMLGNFSFGDYFKEEAITYGWDWVTRVLKLPVDRLYATVYEEDNEAFRLWEKIAPELKNGRILRFGKKDNYWSMGDVGPNGPCSEIHFDRGKSAAADCGKPTCTVNCDCERYVEIWNLVFMQFNTRPDGAIETLPRPSVDTGAGLERITTIMQNVPSNYETDVFREILVDISRLSGKNYSPDASGVSHRVIADHLRALTFCIADGAGLSNEGRGYVLRRILRRAARHGRLLDLHEPFIYKLVPTLVGMMGKVYPEIAKRQSHIENVIRAEEESFGRTLDNGLELFEDIARRVKASGNDTLPGDEIFRLYDTYGFPVDLTEVMAEEKGLKLDLAGFENAMERQQEKSRDAASFDTSMVQEHVKHIDALMKAGLESEKTTDFIYGMESLNAEVRKAVKLPFPNVSLVLDRTPFYVESGGQVADTG
ncbi:MAG: alanine--tRNA ligase, partial [Candidatus Zixiibacteriota bacterium]